MSQNLLSKALVFQAAASRIPIFIFFFTPFLDTPIETLRVVL